MDYFVFFIVFLPAPSFFEPCAAFLSVLTGVADSFFDTLLTAAFDMFAFLTIPLVPAFTPGFFFLAFLSPPANLPDFLRV